MAGKIAKRPADAVVAAINSQCLPPLKKAHMPYLKGTSGAEGVFREGGFAPFSYMEKGTPNFEESLNLVIAPAIPIRTLI